MPIELFPMRKTRKEVTHILISQLFIASARMMK